ncbi:MAG: PilZ domain-containing protein [Spirochaetes bacterium]|nr:PilZ domain-containing protein [Spirochaetota bacterium]
MEDKRKHLRVNIFAFIAVTRNHKKIDAIAYDVSLGGISFVNSQIFEVGDACSIEFNYNGFNLKRSGAVRWRNIISKVVGMKKYGFEFEAVLSDSDFARICELFIEE